MDNKAQILDRYKNYEDRILANRIMDIAEQCKRRFAYDHTHFLDPRQQKIAESVLGTYRDAAYHFDGGIEDSERKVCVIYSGDFDTEDIISPVSLLKFSWDSEYSKKLSHRDFLGSFIGNGIKREMIGDIILEEDNAYAACESDIAQYIQYHIVKIGSAPVSIESVEEVPRQEEKVKIINSTVASLRLDSILSTGFGVSRAKTAEAVKGGKVRLNWEEAVSPSKEVKEGDVVSLRGKGRIVLEEVAGNTKKDRIKITIKKFI